MDAEHEAVLLDASVDDDHDDEGDDEEEQEHDVDGRVSLSRALRQLRLQLRALAGLELAQVHGGEARQVGAGQHAPPAAAVEVQGLPNTNNNVTSIGCCLQTNNHCCLLLLMS